MFSIAMISEAFQSISLAMYHLLSMVSHLFDGSPYHNWWNTPSPFDFGLLMKPLCSIAPSYATALANSNHVSPIPHPKKKPNPNPNIPEITEQWQAKRFEARQRYIRYKMGQKQNPKVFKCIRTKFLDHAWGIQIEIQFTGQKRDRDQIDCKS